MALDRRNESARQIAVAFGAFVNELEIMPLSLVGKLNFSIVGGKGFYFLVIAKYAQHAIARNEKANGKARNRAFRPFGTGNTADA